MSWLQVWHTNPPEPHASGVTPAWQSPLASQQPEQVEVLHFSFAGPQAEADSRVRDSSSAKRMRRRSTRSPHLRKGPRVE